MVLRHYLVLMLLISAAFSDRYVHVCTRSTPGLPLGGFSLEHDIHRSLTHTAQASSNTHDATRCFLNALGEAFQAL